MNRNGDWARIWKEAVVICLKILPHCSPEGDDEDYETPHS
jgi:hypothetical protein